MNFKQGQKVVIGRNLGQRNGNDKSEYYYSGTVKEVPLGSRARIEYTQSNKIYLRLDNGEGWYVHPDELQSKESGETDTINSKDLSNLLSETVPESDSLEKKTAQKEFAPKFNVREEYAIWIREQFPELKTHWARGTDYSALKKRKDEVMDGAKLAYEHALKTTTGCTRSDFRDSYIEISEGNLSRNLGNFVELIERVARNLR